MTEPKFELVELVRLRIHEEISDEDVAKLIQELERTGELIEPIWVDRGSWVILNGHHRFAALRALGAERIPAWLFDYRDPRIRLARWGEGPALSKAEVVQRATEGRPFPPKTSRHLLDFELPSRPTPLSALRPTPGRAPARSPSA
ncbi:MAG: ParB N-terminal domain-containing protein [Thermoplasmata archaeon]|nr:ParB N-terminal domain-containing protein [Thermoplasmata archaeon]